MLSQIRQGIDNCFQYAGGFGQEGVVGGDVNRHAKRVPAQTIIPDYSNPEENIGTSSLLVHEGLKVRKAVDVETVRIDEFIPNYHPSAKRIGPWLDVEGAEYGVLEGMAGIKNRGVALHVETARTPMRIAQKTYSELVPLLAAMGFVPSRSNISRKSIWGDVVFLSQHTLDTLGHRGATGLIGHLPRSSANAPPATSRLKE